MLPDSTILSMFVLLNEAETGTAGEQPVRNSSAKLNWIGLARVSSIYPIQFIIPKKTHFFTLFFNTFCSFYAGAVHLFNELVKILVQLILNSTRR